MKKNGKKKQQVNESGKERAENNIEKEENVERETMVDRGGLHILDKE